MNKMSRKTEYGLMALKVFEQSQGGFVSAKTVAETTHAPFEVTARVLQVLSHKGILQAEYGVNGGYRLAKTLDQISVLDLVESLESSSELAKCLGSPGECDMEKNCTIAKPVAKLNQKIHSFYKSVSIAEVLNG